MILEEGNILEKAQDGDIICFTSNGVVKSNGRLVMGAGVAKTFRDAFTDLDLRMGKAVITRGNIVNYGGDYVLDGKNVFVYSFPTKTHFKYNSSYDLIEKSAVQLLKLYRRLKAANVLEGKIRLTPPGITNGGLPWEGVILILNKYFNDDFVINYLPNQVLQKPSSDGLLFLRESSGEKKLSTIPDITCCQDNNFYFVYHKETGIITLNCNKCNKVHKIIDDEETVLDMLFGSVWL